MNNKGKNGRIEWWAAAHKDTEEDIHVHTVRKRDNNEDHINLVRNNVW